MLHRIYGRAKSGKTERIMRVLESSIAEKKHTFLIVPEQQALIAEREIIRRFGNESNMYIEVINFKRLCNRVFRETGGLSQKYIGLSEKLLIMSEALEAVKPHLLEYSAAAENAEFAEKALSAVIELRGFGITAEALEKAACDTEGKGGVHLSGKLSDLSLILSSYTAILHSGFDDSGDDLDRLYEVLGESSFFAGKRVAVDSFYGFTVQEIRILCRIISSADSTYMTFLLDESKKGDLFSRSVGAFEKLGDYAANAGVDIEDEFLPHTFGYTLDSLLFLEKHFSPFVAAGSEEKFAGEPDGISLIRCRNAFAEADAACALIKELVMEKGVRYSEIALCAREADSLSGIIDTALEKNGIPFNFNVRRELLTRPAIAYILSAFDIMRTGWQQQSVLRHIKTGLCDISDEEADLFESYVKTWSITGRRFLEEEWHMNPDSYTEDFTVRGEYILEKVNVARTKIVLPLCDFIEKVKNSENVNKISQAVFELLSSTKCDEEGKLLVKDGEEAVYWNLTLDALDCMAQIIGDRKMSAARYAELFRLIMSGFDTGKLPLAIDEVTVSSAEGLRGVGIKYMIVLGVNDEVFPAKLAEDSIFSDRDKSVLRDLGIELSRSAADSVIDELFLAYKVITSAEKGVFLLSSEFSSVGDERGKSIITSIIENLFPDIVTESFPFDGERHFLFSKKKLFDMAFTESGASEKRALERFFEEDEELSGLYESYASAENESEIDSLTVETASALYGDKMTLSPSRLESFGNCAFSYYGNYILRLRPEHKAELGGVETGNVSHRILEGLVAKLAKKRENGEMIDKNAAVDEAKAMLSDYLVLLCGKNGASKRFEFLYNRLSGTICELTKSITDELNQSLFIPKEFELPIGMAENGIRSAEIPLPDGGILRINGKIDRTDVFAEDGKAYIRVVDYKTGTKKFNLSDVALGVNLQMLLYLYSIVEPDSEHGNKAVEERFGGKAIPAGVLYIPVKRAEESAILGGEASEDVAVEKSNGILIDDTGVLSAMEKELAGKYIPVKVKKDGGLYASSSVMTLSEIGRLLRCAAEVSAKLAQEMKKGSIAKNPVKCKDINSCAFCELAPLCRYDYGNEKHTRYAMTRYSDAEFSFSGSNRESKEGNESKESKEGKDGKEGEKE